MLPVLALVFKPRLAMASSRCMVSGRTISLSSTLLKRRPQDLQPGGRIAPPALRRLKAKLESLGSPADGAKIDNIVYRSLYPVVWRAEKADACDCEPAVIAEALGIAHLQ